MRHIGVTLRLLGVTGLLLGFGFACGNDSSTDPSDEDDGTGGGTSNGGTGGGSGGSNTASGGSSTTTSTSGGGTGGTSTTPIVGLGAACQQDSDCSDDLICLTDESDALLEGGPANGLCTTPCEAECGSNGVCLSFSDTDAYCMPLCGLGDNVRDCEGRPDMVCDLLPAPVGTACTSSANCSSGQACLSGQCVIGIPVCLPKCATDSDCPSDRFCEPSLGECVDDEPQGLGIDESCDPMASSDECLGFCSVSNDAGDEGRCLQTCSLGVYPACGSESADEGSAACLAALYPTDVADIGDLGKCYGLCDCTSDCPSGLACISFDTEAVNLPESERRGRAGFCDEELEGDDVLDCGVNGAGGDSGN